MADKIASNKKKPSNGFFDITPKMIHDFQFCSTFFLLLIWVLMHYAYIMKQLVIDPWMSWQRIIVHGSLFVADMGLCGYLSLGIIYPYVYKTEIEEEKRATKTTEKKSQ